MYKKILTEVKLLAEPNFAKWIKPFLNINDQSKEIVLGVRVPKLRKLAKSYRDIDYDNINKLLKSKYHEIRALAIFIMLIKVKKDPIIICQMYLNNLNTINNWDLIDYSAPHIIAPLISEQELIELAKSDYLWANRVAMVSTIYYIKQHDFQIALKLARMFITHPHHLMHKATGWMLREIGKKDKKVLIKFLKENSHHMPAVMRNYAKERLKDY